ncbi:uncharacterized protein N7496_007387 [Penicillium cataractarum]|uniref:Enoyl reductase (ER) domain-containing protein n=1 Tax=Penicillium cataractarum TaxID=2100454 RepID=A0A9W9S4N7_9EURO|nr:uncharacterized protein N7496_007387 [Penicillium cataractarum]KAJ5371295.1 hypothetical protein N7496_007387 [Penicillium cataractarum]
MGNFDRQPTMRAWRKHKGNKEPVWEEVSIPLTPSDGLLVKLLASGVCHSDRPLLEVEDRPNFNEKYILGHEGCGEIIEIGDNMKDSRFRLGDRIALLAVPGCGLDSCSECSRDLAQLCPRGVHHGIGQDGFFAEYVAVNPRAAVPLPEGISPAVAAVATDAVTTAYHGITRRAEVKKEETTFLFGLGGLGFNALQVVRTIGARVIVSDLRPEKLDAAFELGVPREDIVPAGQSVQDFVKENGLEGKIDTVLEFVGKHQTFQDAQQIVRPGGKILCVGTLDRTNELDMKIGIRKRLSIIFTYGGQYRDLVEVLDLIAKKVIQPQVEIGKLQDFPKVLKDLEDGKIKDRIALVSDLV